MKINFVINTSPNYAEVQENILSTVKALLHPSEYTEGKYQEGSLNFSLFIRDRADVVMSHGVADKNYFWMSDESGNRYANDLKAVLVPGAWLQQRILKSKKLALREDQVIAVGWPRLDALRQRMAALGHGTPEARKTVLWAPTHDRVKRGAESRSTSSFPDFSRHLAEIGEKFNVEVSVHPRNRESKKPTLDQLLRADYVVSDFGTLVYEAWALGKAVLFPRWILEDRVQQYLPGSAEAYIFNKRIGCHPDSPEEMMAMLCSSPTLTPDVDHFMNAYLTNYGGGSGSQEVVRALRYLAGMTR